MLNYTEKMMWNDIFNVMDNIILVVVILVIILENILTCG